VVAFLDTQPESVLLKRARARLSTKRARHFFIGRKEATAYHLLIRTIDYEIYRRRVPGTLATPGSLIS
jgi:hypothetical protein